MRVFVAVCGLCGYRHERPTMADDVDCPRCGNLLKYIETEVGSKEIGGVSGLKRKKENP